MKKSLVFALLSVSLTAFAGEEDISNYEFLNMIINNDVIVSITNNYTLSNGKASMGPRSIGPVAPYEIKAVGKLKREVIVLSIDNNGALRFTSCNQSVTSVCR